MTALALLFILPGFLRKSAGADHQVHSDQLNLLVLRDQLRELDADRASGTIGAAYDSARADLERRVAEDVQPTAATGARTRQLRTAIVVGIGVPVLAGVLYFFLGNPLGLDPTQRAAPADASHELTDAQIQGMVGQLAERLKQKPDDAQGWGMLARSYSVLGKYKEAVDAYAHLLPLIPENADVLADYADVLAMVQGKNLQGEPERLLERALAINPNQDKALSLSASAAFDRHDFARAIVQWKKLLATVPPDSEPAREISSSIAEAEGLAGMKIAPENLQAAAPPLPDLSAAPAPAAAPAKSAAGHEVSGLVDIDPALRKKAGDNDTVFIFARAANGPRFPLAVLRKQVRDLPVKFTLDDSMSMMPTAKLSDFPMVVVGARISKTGSATPGVGDFEGLIDPVAPGAKDLHIRIGTERK
jgi:cytochrome c-type biogenesis protein CcmH